MTPFSEVITRNEIPRPAKKPRLAKNLEFYPALPSRNVQTAETGAQRLFKSFLARNEHRRFGPAAAMAATRIQRSPGWH